MNWIRGKLADHVGDHVVLSSEGAVLVTYLGTESSYPRPPQSLNNSWRQQRPRICSVRSLCVASVALALIFMSGLYSTAYRATFPAFLCGCLLFVSPLCFFYFFCLSRRCPLLATFLSVLFCLLSLLISERFSGLILFGSVYLVTTAGFVADQLI